MDTITVSIQQGKTMEVEVIWKGERFAITAAVSYPNSINITDSITGHRMTPIADYTYPNLDKMIPLTQWIDGEWHDDFVTEPKRLTSDGREFVDSLTRRWQDTFCG